MSSSTALLDTVSWLVLVQTYIQQYLKDSALSKPAKKVTQTRQQPDKHEKNYGDCLEEYAAKCSSVHLDDRLVNCFVEDLLPNTRNTATEKLHKITISQRSSLSNVLRLA